MIYSNLLIFLSAIFLLSFSAEDTPNPLPLLATASLYAGTLAGFWFLARYRFKAPGTRSPGGYFKTERNLSIAALGCFVIMIFWGDVGTHAAALPFAEQLSLISAVPVLFLFFTYLSVIWVAGLESYSAAFSRPRSAAVFVLSNFKLNLPIILPWLGLSLMYDLLNLIPSDNLRRVLESFWGDLLFLGLFLLLMVSFFPPLVRRLWDCTPFPGGPLKDHLDFFCGKLNFSADLYIWPVHGGRILTAAVMGLLPGLRYVMFTPALLQNLNHTELEAVMAHEIGHVKHRHLFLYVFLIGGFSVAAGALGKPILYGILSIDWIYSIIASEVVTANTLIALISGIPLLVLLLLYFRYVFGYFIRNFERQADLYAFKAMGNSRGLISAFQKILSVSGEKANKPNWHHFSVGERIACLESCERDPSLVRHQNNKVWSSLFLYFAILAVAIFSFSRLQSDQWTHMYESRYIESILMPKIEGIESEAQWYSIFGTLLQGHGADRQAIDAYHTALELEPDNHEVLNNLAWLLLTSEYPELRDPEEALDLALSAAGLAPFPHILDTLATAYWANGYTEKAIRIENQVIALDPGREALYRQQLERFTNEDYRRDTTFID